MGAPKIKVYQLPRGYSTDGDNDVQQAVDDELIPIVDKPIAPEDFYELVGILSVTAGGLLPIAGASGIYYDLLTPDGEAFQYPSSPVGNIFFTDDPSHFNPIVLDESLEVIDPSGYEMTASGVLFLSTPPSGASVYYWLVGTEPGLTFAGAGASGWYTGTNAMFNTHAIYASGVLVDPSGYTCATASGLVTFNAPVSGITADYTYATNVTRYYIGHHDNWIDNHMYMRPDIFKGVYDYPGDDAEDSQGNPITQGAIPKFVENSAYQLDYRRGLVTFAEAFDSSILPVFASFAHLVSVENVTGQQLDLINADPSGVGYVYKAVSDTTFPLSINASWIARNDSYTPRNFYVGGVQKPQLVTVTPYDVLTIKNA